MRNLCAVVAAAGGLAGVASGQQSFTPVSELPGVVEPPTGSVPVNAGQVISGVAPRYVVSRTFTPGRFRTALTTDFVTYTDLPYTPEVTGDIFGGVSDDGTRIATTLTTTDPTRSRRIAVWDPAGAPPQPTVLNLNGLSSQNATGISADGRYVLTYTGFLTGAHVWRLDGQNGYAAMLVDANGEGGDESFPNCISFDGEWVAGGVGGAPGPRFLWNESGAFEYLDSGMDHKPLPLFISDGAQTVVCQSVNVGPAFNNWVTPVRLMGRWSNYGEGEVPRASYNFECLRRDGGMAGGEHAGRAFLWTPTLGIVDCGTELRSRGIDTRGWELTHVRWLTPDGRTIVGQGHLAGLTADRWWIAHVEPFAGADIGKSGGFGGSDGRLDNNDFIVFIDRFFAQDERADIGKAGGERGIDGVFDNNDFIAFVNLFFSGQP